MKTSLHEIGRFEDRLSFLYIDRAVIQQKNKAIAVWETDGMTEVPVASLATLMLGPGVKITHEAIKSLADNNCLVVWAGELGIRFYACGMGGSHHSRNLLGRARPRRHWRRQRVAGRASQRIRRTTCSSGARGRGRSRRTTVESGASG